MLRRGIGIVRRSTSVGASLCVALTFPALAWSQPAKPLPKGAYAKNVEFVGYSDLADRPAFKMCIQEVNGRWYWYGGMVELVGPDGKIDRTRTGWSVVDVTDVTAPKVLNFVPGAPNTRSAQLDYCENGIMETPVQMMPGGDPKQPFEKGFWLWDLKDPVHPTRLGQWQEESTGTHRNAIDWERKVVYAQTTAQGYDGAFIAIVDISDLKKPHEISRWSYPGQHTAAGEKLSEWKASPSVHGPAMPVGNLLYVAYGGAGLVILDVSDIKNPRLAGELAFSPPFPASLGVHSVVPLPDWRGRKFVFVNSEADHGCPDNPDGIVPLAGVVDVTDPKKPFMVANLPTPIPPPGYPQANFCDHGQFGPHNPNVRQNSGFIEKQGNLLYLTYQTAGLHIFDLSDPRLPKEVGYFIPPDPVKRLCVSNPRGDRLYTVIENVLVDTRGYIYIVDRNAGVYILRYTGPGRIAPTARSGQ